MNASHRVCDVGVDCLCDCMLIDAEGVCAMIWLTDMRSLSFNYFVKAEKLPLWRMWGVEYQVGRISLVCSMRILKSLLC